MNIVRPSLVLPNFIEIAIVDPRGQRRVVERGRNTTTYEGQDALGLVMSGQISAHFNGIYFGFDDNGGASPISTSASTKATDFHALTGNNDVARVKLGTHVTDASSGSYNDNRVSISGTADAGLTGIINSNTLTGGVAEVTHFALIVAPDWSDYTEDKVYAVYTPASVVLVPVGSGVTMRWLPEFTL